MRHGYTGGAGAGADDDDRRADEEEPLPRRAVPGCQTSASPLNHYRAASGAQRRFDDDEIGHWPAADQVLLEDPFEVLRRAFAVPVPSG